MELVQITIYARQRKHNSRLGIETSSRQQQLAPVPCSVRCIESPNGFFTMDLFASRMNHQPPVYCSWRMDPGALAVDGFSISWAREFPYLLPPFCIVSRVLSKIQREAVACACLIVPTWPTQVWYSQLLVKLTDLHYFQTMTICY